jgi:hypothetical protein
MAGGIAALIESGTFIFGCALLATVLGPLFQGDLDGTETVRFLAAHETLDYVWNLVISVLFGAMLVVLSLSLQERLREPSRALMPIATAFGLIWAGLVIASGMVANVGAATVIEIASRDPAEAATVWAAVDTVSDGLGGGYRDSRTRSDRPRRPIWNPPDRLVYMGRNHPAQKRPSVKPAIIESQGSY